MWWSDSACYKQWDSPLASGSEYQGEKERAARVENSRSENCNFKLTDCSEYNSVTSHVASSVLSDSTKVTFASSPARTEGYLKPIISCKLWKIKTQLKQHGISVTDLYMGSISLQAACFLSQLIKTCHLQLRHKANAHILEFIASEFSQI